MFKDSFQKLDLAEIATFIDRLNPELDEVEFDPVEATILAADLPFYPGFRLLEVSDHSISPPLKRFVISGQDDLYVLDFTNDPIYTLNKHVPIMLNQDTVFDYVLFFFFYVKGRHGRFLIVEDSDEVSWKQEQSPVARKVHKRIITPLIMIEADNGHYHMEGTMVFKDSLFKSQIHVSPDGHVTLKDEELLIERLPVLDDVLD